MCAQRESNVFGSLLIDSSPCKICGTVFEVASNLRCAFSGLKTRQTTYTLAPMPEGKLALSFSCPCKIGFSSNPLPFSFLHRPLPQPFGSPFKPRGGRLGVGKLQEPLCMLRYFFPSSSSTPLLGVVRVGFLLLLLDHARCCSM